MKLIADNYLYKAQSYWRNNELYDTYRNKERTIKVFGLTVYHYKEEFRSDATDNDKPVGYKK